MSSFRRRVLVLTGLCILTGAVVYGLHIPIQGGLTTKTLLDPVSGLYHTARTAVPTADSTLLRIPGVEERVTIVRDRRHVPHIYAKSDRDAIVALGYVAAKDRLFQLDFAPRVASGRLSEAFGAQSIKADEFLRRTGMEWGAQKNLERIKAEDGIELRALQWYGKGVNAYIDRQSRADLPLEFRLLGYTPDRFTPIQALRLLQYMNYDLTYDSDDPVYTELRRELGPSTYQHLYPEHPPGLFVPIIPPDQQINQKDLAYHGDEDRSHFADARSVFESRRKGERAVESFLEARNAVGKGSNNWAVHGARSETDAPLLAGDMHLSVSLPSIWYEAHVVTPSMNIYGLTIPGAPVFVQAFNEHVGWTMTNTGADQIDHFALDLDTSGTRYRYEGEWRELRRVIDTIFVNGGAPVVDTMYYSHYGPVRLSEGASGTQAVAEQWTAHKLSRTLRALWKMNRADRISEVTEALRDWDTPMQNLLYAGRQGDIAIRSAGHLPVRRGGHGRGLLDGSTDEYEWTGRVPFDSLPAARNPDVEYLTSTNQKPTGPNYPYYLGHNWPDGYRSLRIDSLLGGASSHSVADFKRYQSDVYVQQRDIFVPFLASIGDLPPRADTLRQLLVSWNGEASVDRPEPLVFDEFLSLLRDMMWDEAVFATAPDPEDATLVHLLRTNPQARWFDRQSTEREESATDLLRSVLTTTVDTMTSRYGWTPEEWRWGDHHHITFRHLSGSDQLRPLWRGPFEYPGFASTLSPGEGRTVTHSASQRVIIDFSTRPPTGYGVVPGGQRGNPLDPYFYDTQIPTYLNFDYFRLKAPRRPSMITSEERRSTRLLAPTE